MSKAVFISLCIILLGLLIVSVAFIVIPLFHQLEDEEIYEDIRPIPLIIEAEPEENIEDDSEDQMNEDASDLTYSLTYEGNGDCIGWITIPGTAVDYPVMHTPDDPEYYLRRNYYKQSSQAGVPFLDGRCVQDESANLIVYGHNMKSGVMFASLKNYLKASFAETHREIYFMPYDSTEGVFYRNSFQVFAVCTTDTSDPWYSFIRSDSKDYYDSMISYIKNKSVFLSELTPVYGDTLLTLSTCYGSAKNGRLLVIAVKAQ